MQKLQENTLWEVDPDWELEELATDDVFKPRVRFNQVPGLLPPPPPSLESLVGDPEVGWLADTSPTPSSILAV